MKYPQFLHSNISNLTTWVLQKKGFIFMIFYGFQDIEQLGNRS